MKLTAWIIYRPNKWARWFCADSLPRRLSGAGHSVQSVSDGHVSVRGYGDRRGWGGSEWRDRAVRRPGLHHTGRLGPRAGKELADL